MNSVMALYSIQTIDEFMAWYRVGRHCFPNNTSDQSDVESSVSIEATIERKVNGLAKSQRLVTAVWLVLAECVIQTIYSIYITIEYLSISISYQSEWCIIVISLDTCARNAIIRIRQANTCHTA